MRHQQVPHSCLPGAPGSGPRTSLPRLRSSCVPSGSASRAPGLVRALARGWAPGAKGLCPRAPGGQSDRTGLRGELVCPQSGLELKLEVQGELTWVTDAQEMSLSCGGPGGGQEGEEPPWPSPVGAFVAVGPRGSQTPGLLGRGAASHPAAGLLFLRGWSAASPLLYTPPTPPHCCSRPRLLLNSGASQRLRALASSPSAVSRLPETCCE